MSKSIQQKIDIDISKLKRGHFYIVPSGCGNGKTFWMSDTLWDQIIDQNTNGVATIPA